MKKTGDKWETDNCSNCGEIHKNFSGKLDKNGNEYVICSNQKIVVRINDLQKMEVKEAFHSDLNWNKSHDQDS